MNGVGWGLIGASTIAREWVIDAIRQAGGHIACAMSSDEARARDFSRDNGIPASTTSLDKVLAEPGVDAVYISTTNELHRGQTLAAAAAGKHVLCEKPLALTLADAREMVAACKRARRHGDEPSSAQCRHAYRDARGDRAGAIGRPLFARVFHAVYLPPHLQGWRIKDAAAGGGVVLDITVHDADTLRFVLGDEPVEVVAHDPARRHGEGGLEDGVMGVMRFRSGLLAQFHDAFTTSYAGTGFEVHGTEGSLIGRDVHDPDAVGRSLLRNADGERDCRLDTDNLYRARRAHSMPRSAARASRRPPARTACAPWRLALAVLEAARSRAGDVIASDPGL